MEFAAELQASLQEFTASGIVEVRENGGRLANLEIVRVGLAESWRRGLRMVMRQ